MTEKKTRLDALLVERGYYVDTDAAKRAIYAREVTSPSIEKLTPGLKVLESVQINVRTAEPYVSRGGLKLAAALAEFRIDVTRFRCIDIGAGSGGFSDCLLQNGAASVTAVDVGYGQFDWRLREDTRIKLLERTNFTKLEVPQAEQAFDLAVVDLSFTRTSRLLGRIRSFLSPEGQMVILIKPQFELSLKQQQSDGFQAGVVVDPELHLQVLEIFLAKAKASQITTRGLIPTPIKGADGNREFLFWGTLQGIDANIDLQDVIGSASDVS
jgi:23S rRNA (cytidine1920-2'-O)/16S rRNA (cytidine1409-2'-O)-methyltransferase